MTTTQVRAPSGARRAGTSTAPTGRALWRRARAPLLALALLVLVSLGLVLVQARGSGGDLDPRSYRPGGSRALAALLEQRGVPVRVVGDLPAVRAGLQSQSTVLVPRPDLLSDDELRELGGLDARVVVVGADQEQVRALRLQVTVRDAPVRTRRPDCPLPAARTAGPADSGGQSYSPDDPARPAVGCYADAGRPTLLQVDGRTTLLGTERVLSNDRLAQQGDAALALGLLGAGDELRWLLPDPARAVPGRPRSLTDLLPDGVLLGVLQLCVAAVLLALWRARRLGPVVAEPLPVLVRAAETVEGRGRLYRLAGARGTAAQALRAGVGERLARRSGLPRTAGGGPLVAVVAERTGRDPREVADLLLGPEPADDAALVRLARALDGLLADLHDGRAPPRAPAGASAPPDSTTARLPEDTPHDGP